MRATDYATVARLPNSAATELRISTMMVNTPSAVPIGMKRHEMPAITTQNV